MTDKETRNYFRTFARISIDAMKDLASKGEKLSSKALADAMASHKDFKSLTQKPMPTQLFQEENKDAEELEKLKSQSKVIQSQKDQLLKQLQEIEDRQMKAETFYKNAIMTLINIFSGEKENALSTPLRKFKVLLQKENNINIFNDAFNRIKDATLREDFQITIPPASDTQIKTTSILSRWFKKPVSETLGGEDIQEIFYEHLKTAYQDIVDELGLFLGENYLKKLSRISKQIFKSGNFDELSLIQKNILAIIQEYFNNASSERELTADIIREIGERMLQVEEHIIATFSAASENINKNSEFNTTLEKQFAELQNTVNFSKTLNELKKALISRLNVLNDTLANKVKLDLQQKEKAEKQMAKLKKSLSQMNDRILSANDTNKRLARELLTDPLTDIYNRRAYDRRINEEIARYRRYETIFSLLLFDVDHFKRINDRYGHAIGDKCLQEIIKRIKPVLRESDFFARYGGEEFIILLPETNQKGATVVAEKLRSLVENIDFLHKENRVKITISIGVTGVLPEDENHETIFSRVDLAMYEAKNSGRNRVVER